MEEWTKTAARRKKRALVRKTAWQNRALYGMILPALIYVGIFHYAPMYGVQIAFKNFTLGKGILGSPWAGWKWFDYFFSSPKFQTVVVNTISISLYSLLVGLPMPILLALMMHNVAGRKFVRTVQTITYMPHFISVVVLVGMMSCFFSINSGFINTMIEAFGGSRKYFMGEPKYFIHLYVWSGVWQGVGWGSILYMAALTGVSPELHEAAMIDGASKIKRIWHIEIPALVPTIVIMLIMNVGSIMSVGFDKVYLMQNSLNISVSETISTYNYKMGLEGTKYSFSAAIGLFNNVINFALLSIVNFLAKRISGSSLW